MTTPKSPDRKRKHQRPSTGRRQRRISIRSELRREPDVQRIAKAIIALAMAQAEKEAAEEAAARSNTGPAEPADE